MLPLTLVPCSWRLQELLQSGVLPLTEVPLSEVGTAIAGLERSGALSKQDVRTTLPLSAFLVRFSSLLLPFYLSLSLGLRLEDSKMLVHNRAHTAASGWPAASLRFACTSPMPRGTTKPDPQLLPTHCLARMASPQCPRNLHIVTLAANRPSLGF